MAGDENVVRVCSIDDVKPGTAMAFEVGGNRIALVRTGDEFHAVEDRCSHADYALSEGEVYPDDRTIECWKHGSTFSLITGEPQSLPATKPVPVYEVRVVDSDVMVVLPQ